MTMLSVNEIEKNILPVCRRYGISSAYLFGSYARGDATEKSDIDLFVDSKLKGLNFVGFVEDLREALNEKIVDVLNSSHVESNSSILAEIKKTGIRVYAK